MSVIALDNCPICDSRNLAVVRRPRHWIGEAFFAPYADALCLMHCRECSFVFVNPRPDPSLLDEFYSSHDFAHNSIGAREHASQKAALQLAQVERFMASRDGARLLDYGCGDGQLVQEALAAGWNALGYDVGVPAIAACQQQGLPIVNALTDADGHFDVIVLSHVLEHLAEPALTLEYLKTKLTPNGLLCLEVPNAKSLRAMLSPPLATDWLGFDERYRAFPIHLSYFTPRTLLRLLRKHGFVADQVTTMGLGLETLIVHRDEHEVQKPSSWVDHASNAQGTLRRIAIDAFKKVFFGLRMGENLLVIARVSEHGWP